MKKLNLNVFFSILAIFIALAVVFSACNPKEILHRPANLSSVNAANATKVKTNMSEIKSAFYDLSFESLTGETVSMSQFEGKKVVILNVASACGYTPQYDDWQKFYEAHKSEIVVIGFPCNQFGGQESGSSSEIKTFCQKNYGVTFLMASKVAVKGKNAAPVYQWLTDKTKNGWNETAPSWNFCKYLVNEKGELVEFFASAIKPNDESFAAAIKK